MIPDSDSIRDVLAGANITATEVRNSLSTSNVGIKGFNVYAGNVYTGNVYTGNVYTATLAELSEVRKLTPYIVSELVANNPLKLADFQCLVKILTFTGSIVFRMRLSKTVTDVRATYAIRKMIVPTEDTTSSAWDMEVATPKKQGIIYVIADLNYRDSTGMHVAYETALIDARYVY
jgi:hypothetical protein